MGNVEGVAVVVEAVGRAVGGQFALQRDAGQVEQVAHACSRTRPASAGAARSGLRPASLACSALTSMSCSHFSAVGCLRRGRSGFFGRHFARLDAVVDLDPAAKLSGIGRFDLERGEIEARPSWVGVVALEAVLLEKRGGLGPAAAGTQNTRGA